MVTNYKGNPEAARTALEQMNISYDDDTFLKCVEEGNTRAVELFLEAGIKLDAKTMYDANAFMLAAHNGHVDILKLLLSAGVDVNESSEDGVTALMVAAHAGHAGVVELLLSRGAECPCREQQRLDGAAAGGGQ